MYHLILMMTSSSNLLFCPNKIITGRTEKSAFPVSQQPCNCDGSVLILADSRKTGVVTYCRINKNSLTL